MCITTLLPTPSSLWTYFCCESVNILVFSVFLMCLVTNCPSQHLTFFWADRNADLHEYQILKWGSVTHSMLVTVPMILLFSFNAHLPVDSLISAFQILTAIFSHQVGLGTFSSDGSYEPGWYAHCPFRAHLSTLCSGLEPCQSVRYMPVIIWIGSHKAC